MPKFQVSKSITVDAPMDRVFEALVDFRTWTTWSPWLIVEPSAKVTVSENHSGVGATYHWVGEVTGEGQIKHRKLEPNSLIEDDLHFIKPFKSYADVVFRLAAAGQGTKITWSMDSSLPWFLFWMVPMMKTLLGMDYGRGLAMFKEWIETGSVASQVTVHGIERTKGFRMIGIAASSPVEQIGPSMEKTFGQAQAELQRLGISQDGGTVSVYTKFNMKEGVFDYISGCIVPDSVRIPTDSKLQSWTLPDCQVFRVEHRGSYKHLGNAWSVANQLARYKKLKQSRIGTYEVYRTVPPVPEQELVTDIFLPLK
jgi:effector-binding domain-containing protein/uncharacterized protein YndB with AHSA1/START domain